MQKIRVCHVASGDAWGGAEAQIAMLLPELLRYRELHLTAILFNDGRLSNELKEKGVPVIIFDENMLSSWKLFRKLLQFFLQNPTDILHTHGYKQHILGTFSRSFTGVRHIITTIHGEKEPFVGMARMRILLYTFLENLANKFFTDSIIAVSNHIRMELIKRTKVPVVTIHNGIEISRVKPGLNSEVVKNNLRIKRDEFIVGTIGRIVSVKGLDYFLKASKLVSDEISNIKFLIVGEGPSKKDLEEMVHELKIHHKVFSSSSTKGIYSKGSISLIRSKPFKSFWAFL